MPGVFSFLESMYKNVICDQVTPQIGSVLRIDLAIDYHSGIYIGNDQIVELSSSGEIQIVDSHDFLYGGGLAVMAAYIYVACRKDSDGSYHPVGSRSVANRARAKAGSCRNYNCLLDNCHQFSSGCITGDFENSDNFCWMLEMTIEKHLNRGNDVYWMSCGENITR